jgi:hypothetical protein
MVGFWKIDGVESTGASSLLGGGADSWLDCSLAALSVASIDGIAATAR